MRICLCPLLAAALCSLPLAAQSLSHEEAHRFLSRATFGPTPAEVEELRRVGYDAWFEKQFSMRPTSYPGDLDDKPMEWAQDYFFQNAISAPDQLRQRLAFALHKIFVVSAVEVGNSGAMLGYLRMLGGNAFENYYVVLKHTALHPAMGEYLNAVNNAKAESGSNRLPNENFARELLQLFSIGTVMLNRDGTPQLDANGAPVPAYSQDEIRSFARVFTGWTYPSRNGQPPRDRNSAYYQGFMMPVERYHDTAEKTLLLGEVAPAGQTAEQDLDVAISNVYWHPNVGPFIGRQLIQQFVTSNPSPEYVARVASAWEDNGAGVRGDLKAAVRAVLMDPEAMAPGTGRLREPALFVSALMRAIGGQIADHPFLSYEAAEMGQKILFPPTVFSYFEPGFRLPGNPAVAAPEFQLINNDTALRRVNYVAQLLYGSFGSEVTVDFSRFLAVASDAAALTRLVDQDLTGNTMPDEMRDAIRAAVEGQGPDRETRVRTALYLAGSSPYFQVVR